MIQIPYEYWTTDSRTNTPYLATHSYWTNFIRSVENAAGGDKKRGYEIYDEYAKEWRVKCHLYTGMLKFQCEEDAVMFVVRWS